VSVAGGGIFDPPALATLTATWIVLSLGLAMNVRHTIKNPRDWGIGLCIAYAVLVFQIIRPIMVSSFSVAPSYSTHYILAIPVPSILATRSYAMFYRKSARTSAD